MLVCQCDVKCLSLKIQESAEKDIFCVNINLVNIKANGEDVMDRLKDRSWAQYGEGFQLPAVSHCPSQEESGQKLGTKSQSANHKPPYMLFWGEIERNNVVTCFIFHVKNL